MLQKKHVRTQDLFQKCRAYCMIYDIKKIALIVEEFQETHFIFYYESVETVSILLWCPPIWYRIELTRPNKPDIYFFLFSYVG